MGWWYINVITFSTLNYLWLYLRREGGGWRKTSESYWKAIELIPRKRAPWEDFWKCHVGARKPNRGPSQINEPFLHSPSQQAEPPHRSNRYTTWKKRFDCRTVPKEHQPLKVFRIRLQTDIHGPIDLILILKPKIYHHLSMIRIMFELEAR